MADESGKDDLRDEPVDSAYDLEQEAKMAALEAALAGGDACDPADDVDGPTFMKELGEYIMDLDRAKKAGRISV